MKTLAKESVKKKELNIFAWTRAKVTEEQQNLSNELNKDEEFLKNQ